MGKNSPELFFVKSFEPDFATKTLIGRRKAVCQKIEEIVKLRKIFPNTKSFGRKKRLSCTIIHKNYTKTYRPQGIIFQTSAKPDYVFPFDLALLTADENIIVHYYRIKDNLHLYYNRKLISGNEKFIFKNLNGVLKNFKSPKDAWKKVNDFRKKHGYPRLPNSKFRLVEYNEAVFHKPINITPVALFGYSKKSRNLAKRLSLLHFKSAKDFYKSQK